MERRESKAAECMLALVSILFRFHDPFNLASEGERVCRDRRSLSSRGAFLFPLDSGFGYICEECFCTQLSAKWGEKFRN
jgi:hypothetical protein